MELEPTVILNSPIADHEQHWLELRCCKGVTYYPIRLIVQDHKGRGTVGDVVKRLRCKRCGGRPAEVGITDNAQQTELVSGWTVQLTL